jgi:hypothetical protein
MENQVVFINDKRRKNLTAQEVNYWKLNLNRILKVGAEFEFNLPEKSSGSCEGNSYVCSCKNYRNNEMTCWKECQTKEICAKIPNKNTCSINLSGKCKKQECDNCKDYKFVCHGEMCSSFSSPCLVCDAFEPDCDVCKYKFDPKKNPDAIRTMCSNYFNPSGSYGIMSSSGVHNVTTDGSLLGKKGMEVITTGRRIDYWEFFNMSKNIIENSVNKGAYVNERCSIHMHVLASYYGKVVGTGTANNPFTSNQGHPTRVSELEKSMPEIIMINLHQLVRKYQNAITWMTSGLSDTDKLTRWEKFRVSVLKVSPNNKSMRSVIQSVIDTCGGSKYSWINYKFCEFDENDWLKRLHVEFRTMDGLLSPSAVSAFACLYYALMIKAVELSRYGVIDIDNSEGGKWLKRSTIIKKALMNNCSDWQEGNKYGRFSDTSELGPFVEKLVAESYELISNLKHILAPVGPAYEVLEKLAESPCSVRRCNGDSWEKIERDLMVELTEEGVFEYELNKLIDTRAVTGTKNVSDWLSNVSDIIAGMNHVNTSKMKKQEIMNMINNYVCEKQSNGKMIWADKIGSVISI